MIYRGQGFLAVVGMILTCMKINVGGRVFLLPTLQAGFTSVANWGGGLGGVGGGGLRKSESGIRELGKARRKFKGGQV
jgi:hypothetical protein